MDALNLAEALATRLCHDLAGPISACGNGLELLSSEDDASMKEQAMELMHMSAQEGIIRLQLFRTAFGQLKDIASADTEETRLMVEGYFSRSTVRLDWPGGGKAGFDKAIANPMRQVLCGMVLFTAGILAYGGRLSVRGGHNTITLTGTHKRLKEDIAAIAAVNGAEADTPLTAYTVIPHFLRVVAQNSGINLTCALKDAPEGRQIELIAEYP